MTISEALLLSILRETIRRSLDAHRCGFDCTACRGLDDAIALIDQNVREGVARGRAVAERMERRMPQ